MIDNLRERDFEDDICAFLCSEGGYTAGDPQRFDRERALDTETLLNFVRESQPREWHRHELKNPDRAEKVFLDRFCKEVKERSLINVLRQGFVILGVPFKAVFWKPETGLNPESMRRYKANILHCTRQLHYSPSNKNSVDVALFVNGIPVVCLELKNPFTGQNVDRAVQQFKEDRSPDEPFFRFKQRVLTCFAVDPYHVKMTTRLNKEKTFFLPFDQGSNGAGEIGGSGNPSPEGRDYPTAYLWKKVLCRDSLLELLQKFLHLEVATEKNPKTGKTVTKETMIFPRYHQWDVVKKLLADVRKRADSKELKLGHNYLIQHSAGSGKSNSIAWLAHRLYSLHNGSDEKIFRSVIVVTDRKVLDRQLQHTIEQFEQVEGVVVPITQNSAQLRNAINDGAAIIITTLQKFPVIFKEVEHRGDNYAVIVDEAHSSQTGNAALKLKSALADLDAALAEYAEQEGRTEEEEEKKKDELWMEMASQGTHHNMSFFAFTATPKDKTLQLFGTRQPDGSFRAFHIYSMRQAIEEGFILNVLQHYTTYQCYFRLLQRAENDPNYAKEAASRAALHFATLHPHNIAQKTAVMLDHFRTVTARKMGGRAKAMLVTSSRLHAVRYMLEFDRQIREGHMDDVKALVAFSGEVKDREQSYTEVGMNRQIHGRSISEKELPGVFSEDFNILIVAEKYQTGFDEPQLHTMFVDKKLSGVRAVQTLSRLNRTARGKEDTFILDFANSLEDIKKSFAPFIDSTVLEEETDPNIVYDIRRRLSDFHVYTAEQVEAFGKALRKPKGRKDLGGALAATTSLLQPVLDNVAALDEEQRRAFRTGLFRFVRLYNFVTQICRIFDEDMHIYSLFAKKLASSLPTENEGAVNLEGQIDLEYYKLVKTEEDKEIPLEASEKGYSGIKGDSGSASVKEFDVLSHIVNSINERFKTNFSPLDQVHTLRQITERVATIDPCLSNLDYASNPRGWDMLYKSSFAKGLMEVAMGNAAFFSLFKNADALEYLEGALRSSIREEIERQQAGS